MVPAMRVILLLVLVSVSLGAKTKCLKKKQRLVRKLLMGSSAMSPWSTRATSRATSNLGQMSVTPWTYRETYEPSRLPSRIFEAQCSTSGCLNHRGEEDATLRAAPINYQILVLHKERNNCKKKKKYFFSLRAQEVTVGCTCVRPTILPQQEEPDK